MPTKNARTAIAAALRSVPVFASASAEACARLAERAERLDVPARRRISSAGDPATDVHALLEGAVRIFHEAPDAQVTVKQLCAPCTISEKEVIAKSLLLECAETLTPCTLVRIPAEDYLAHLGPLTTPAGLALVDICKRFCIAIQNERAMLTPVPSRLASFLLSLAELFGQPTPRGVKLLQPLSQHDLANGIGGSLRSVSRVVADWQKRGVIRRERGWIVICDVGALAREAGSLRDNLNYLAREQGT